MRDLFEIRSSRGIHPVRITSDSVRETVEACDGTLVIADAFFRQELATLSRPAVFVDATEAAKEFASVGPLIDECRRAGLARNGHILAVGGGVVQDIACFIASVYMRGVSWSFLPTTLLAMVDSCIGGKSSINVGAFKNLVGSFYPPDAIIIPAAAVDTLPPEHVAAGECEAAKICFARGDKSFDRYIELAHERSDVEQMVRLSLSAKKWFVEVDEFDNNERLLLNFGHSFGHALESCSDYDVIHGVAVGVGCLSAVEFSATDNSRVRDVPRVQALVEDLDGILSKLHGLRRSLDGVAREDFFRFWGNDKKHGPRAYRPILLDDRGHLYRATLDRNEATDNRIWHAFTTARDRITA